MGSSPSLVGGQAPSHSHIGPLQVESNRLHKQVASNGIVNAAVECISVTALSRTGEAMIMGA